MKKTPLFLLIVSTFIPSLTGCKTNNPIKTIYFTASGWFNTQAPTLNIYRYDKEGNSLENKTYGTMMNNSYYDKETFTNVWKFDLDTTKVGKIQFFRTWNEGQNDGNARTRILELPDFKNYNGYKVTSFGTWFNGSNYTEVELTKYDENNENHEKPEIEKPDIPDEPLIEETYTDKIIVPDVKEVEGKGKKIEEDLTTTNIIDDNYRNYYEIFVGSFYDTNNDGIGDLKGVTKKLDYIKNSGYNGIWLMPIFVSPTYHKYDTTDYYLIDPDYGTMDDLDELLDEAHKRGIKVILDMVVNHCSDKSEIFKKSADCYEKYINKETLEEKEQVYKDYFAFSNVEDGGSYRKFYKVPGKNFFVEGNFPGGMCEWNLESTHTKKYFEDIFKFYIDKGVDGFRLDAVRYYFINNEEKSISYLNELNDYCKSLNPNFYIVGECWGSDPEQVSRFYTSNIDSYFNFKCSSSVPSNYILESFDLDGLYKDSYFRGIKASEVEANGHIPAVMLDNHDMRRVATTDLEKTKFQYALLSMHKGNTFTYYGDEIGADGDNKNHDENVRTFMNWSDENLTGLTLNPHGENRNYYQNPALNKQVDDPYSIYNFYKKINFLRNQIPTIARGDMLETSFCSDDERILRIDKKYLDDEIQILMNFSQFEYGVYDYSTTKYTDVIGQITATKNTYIGDLGNKKLSIPPLGIAIIR